MPYWKIGNAIIKNKPFALLIILILMFISLSIMFGVSQALANGNCELGIASVSPFGYECK